MLQIQTLFKCMDKLDDLLVGVLRRHHQLFSFRTEEGIDYLTLHVEYVMSGILCAMYRGQFLCYYVYKVCIGGRAYKCDAKLATEYVCSSCLSSMCIVCLQSIPANLTSSNLNTR